MPEALYQNRYTQIVQNLLLFTIACTPLFCLREFLKFSGFTHLPMSFLFLNLSKDFLLGVVFIAGIISLVQHKTYPKRVLPFFIFFFAFTALVALLSLGDVLMVVAGLRWSLPLLLLFLLCPYIDGPFLHRLAQVCIFLLIATTLIQLYQVATRQFHWGTSFRTDVLGRVPGFYELPSTAGVVTCLFFFIIRYYYIGPMLLRRALLLLAVASNFLLSISTTGFVLMLIMLFFPLLYRPGKFRPVYVASAFVLTVVTYFFLDVLNGRFPGDSSFSWNVRIDLMQTELHRSQLVSTRFGNASNAVMILKTALHRPVDPATISGGGESFYPPLLGNYGSIFFILFIGLLLYLFISVVKYRTEAKTLFFFIAVLAALTVRITEVFPLSILISILAAYFIGSKEENRIVSSTNFKQAIPESRDKLGNRQ